MPSEAHIYLFIKLSPYLTKDHNSPMVILEAGSPVRGLEQGLQSAGEVDEPIAHEEEHGEQRSEDVDVSEQDAALADQHC